MKFKFPTRKQLIKDITNLLNKDRVLIKLVTYSLCNEDGSQFKEEVLSIGKDGITTKPYGYKIEVIIKNRKKTK